MRKILTLIAMLFSLLSFLIFILTPMPGGALLFAVSLVFLICTSEWAAQRILALRARFNTFNKGMVWLEDNTGERLGSVLRSTRPDSETENNTAA